MILTGGYVLVHTEFHIPDSLKFTFRILGVPVTAPFSFVAVTLATVMCGVGLVLYLSSFPSFFSTSSISIFPCCCVGSIFVVGFTVFFSTRVRGGER